MGVTPSEEVQKGLKGKNMIMSPYPMSWICWVACGIPFQFEIFNEMIQRSKGPDGIFDNGVSFGKNNENDAPGLKDSIPFQECTD